jgi:hypothetical protein
LARLFLRRCTICDPVTLSLGLAASAGGSLWGQQNSLNNAQRQANAENGVLSTAINGLDQDYNNINAPAFANAVAGIPTAGSLGAAQGARTNTILGNISAPPTTPSPGDTGASPAVSAAKGADMKAAFGRATDAAKATGTLGGYGDSWLNSGLTDQAAGRTIGIGNLFANETKSLIQPEQDLAAAAAYRTPSPWSTLMQGAGNVLASASGNQNSSLVQGLNGALNGLQLGTPYMPSGGFGVWPSGDAVNPAASGGGFGDWG